MWAWDCGSQPGTRVGQKPQPAVVSLTWHGWEPGIVGVCWEPETRGATSGHGNHSQCWDEKAPWIIEASGSLRPSKMPGTAGASRLWSELGERSGLWVLAGNHLGPQGLAGLALGSMVKLYTHSLSFSHSVGVSLHIGLPGCGGGEMGVMWFYLFYLPLCIFSYFCASFRCCNPSAGILSFCKSIFIHR